MGLFKKKAAGTGELDGLKAEIAAMAARLDKADTDKHELGSKVQGIVSRLDTPIAPPPAPPEPPKPAVTEADINMLQARLQRLTDRIDAIDARITSIATELANQINELAGEVGTLTVANNQPAWNDTEGDDGVAAEAAAQAAAAGALASAAEAIAVEIRDAQVKLANEQARYQIAFRHELAELAERLKRG
jgi:chromosome segregation ATPase